MKGFIINPLQKLESSRKSINYFLFTPFVSNGNDSSIDHHQGDGLSAPVQTGPWVHPVSCKMVKAAEAWR